MNLFAPVSNNANKESRIGQPREMSPRKQGDCTSVSGCDTISVARKKRGAKRDENFSAKLRANPTLVFAHTAAPLSGNLFPRKDAVTL